MSNALSLYMLFHLNLAYSSIEEEQRAEVVQKCYWPLLKLARRYRIPFGIEATAWTLETIHDLDPKWTQEFVALVQEGICEFIGSGYAQSIGPLMPSEVNAANQRLGQNAYQKLLGFKPKVVLVNEQAYSAGMVAHYKRAGYETLVMEWDNPAREHAEWNPQWRYYPHIVCGKNGEEMNLIWNKSIAFQKFQRYAHGEMEIEEYLHYLQKHVAETPRAFSLYGNDVEIFDFRPGRYHTEATLQNISEWKRIETLFETLMSSPTFQFIKPSEVLQFLSLPQAGQKLQLQSAASPIPVKKQEKYNITRWAVTGRDDLGVNTACWRIYEAFKKRPQTSDDEWRELCYLWSSDFRTHITEKRWNKFKQRLLSFENQICGAKSLNAPNLKPVDVQSISGLARQGRYIYFENESTKLKLNCAKGLAIDGLWFKNISDESLIGTLPHGYYENISYGADYYTGHLTFESVGHAKVTDLAVVEPQFYENENQLQIQVTIKTNLGDILKSVTIFKSECAVEIRYKLMWPNFPVGSLRLGHITLNPKAFDKKSLFYAAANGDVQEKFAIGAVDVDHAKSVSMLVSASQGLGITDGIIELGDERKSVLVKIDKTAAALIGFVSCQSVGDSYFYRLTLSASEIDETSRMRQSEGKSLNFCLRLCCP